MSAVAEYKTKDDISLLYQCSVCRAMLIHAKSGERILWLLRIDASVTYNDDIFKYWQEVTGSATDEVVMSSKCPPWEVKLIRLSPIRLPAN